MTERRQLGSSPRGLLPWAVSGCVFRLPEGRRVVTSGSDTSGQRRWAHQSSQREHESTLLSLGWVGSLRINCYNHSGESWGSQLARDHDKMLIQASRRIMKRNRCKGTDSRHKFQLKITIIEDLVTGHTNGVRSQACEISRVVINKSADKATCAWHTLRRRQSPTSR